MKCNKCEAEWKIDASRSASITACPFCQEKIDADKSGAWKYFDNTKELLEYVAAEYGNVALFGRKHFSDHTSPMMPQGQKNLVKQAFDCGAVKILQDNVSSDQQHKAIAVKQAVGKMIDTYASAKEAAERVVWELTNAIGWGIDEPTASTSPPPPQPRKPQPAAQSVAPSISAFMTRAWQFAEDGDWKESANYFNKVLDSDPSYAPAFLGLLCVELKVSKEDKLANVKDPGYITNHKYYKRVVTDPVIKLQLNGYIQTIEARIDAEKKAAAAEAERKRKSAEEAARKKLVQDAFDNACRIMDSAQNLDDYSKAITAFGSIDTNYQDISSQIKIKIDDCERRMQQMVAELDKALAPFREKYSPKVKSEKQAKLQEQRKTDLERLKTENARIKAEVEAKCEQIKREFYAAHKAWQEENNRIKATYDNKCKKWEFDSYAIEAQSDRRRSQGLCPHCGGTLKGVLLAKKCTECRKSPSEPTRTPPAPVQPIYPGEPRLPQLPTHTSKTLDESRYVIRENSNSAINQLITLAGIEWRILDVQGGKLLLISEKILKKQAYHKPVGYITWENCTLRKYLNSEFYNKLGAAKTVIAETRNNNPNNPWYGTSGGNTTTDKVFLLSLDEMVRYFGDSGDLNNKNTKDYGGNTKSKYLRDQYNNARIANYGSEGALSWWLRSLGRISHNAAYVLEAGSVGVGGIDVRTGTVGVRPAMWLNL